MEHKTKAGKENIRPSDDSNIKKSSKKRSLAEMQAQHSDEEDRPIVPTKKFRPNNYRSETPPEFMSTPSSEDSIE